MIGEQSDSQNKPSGINNVNKLQHESLPSNKNDNRHSDQSIFECFIQKSKEDMKHSALYKK